MEFDNNVYNQIEAFIGGTMNASERSIFEKEIKSNAALRKEVDLHRSLKKAIQGEELDLVKNEEDNATFTQIREIRRSEKYTTIEDSIGKIADAYFEKEVITQKPKRWLYYIGSAVAVVIIAFLIQYNTRTLSTETLYAEYSNWQDLPSLTLQNTTANILAEGEQLFLTNEYAKAIVIFSEIAENQSLKNELPNPYVLSYLGASYLEINDYENALSTFDQLLRSNSVDSSKGYWYKAMVYLKQGNKEKVREELKLILGDEDNFNFQKAQELCVALHFDQLCN